MGISLSGALIYLNYNDSQQNEAKPFLDFHGCSDHTVPYSCVDFPGGLVAGAASVLKCHARERGGGGCHRGSECP